MANADHQSYHYHQQQNLRQERRLAQWAASRGIDLEALWRHPCAGDIGLLISVQEEYEAEYRSNRTLYATYNALWSGVYSRKRRLTDRDLRRLETIVKASNEIRQHNDQLRYRILQLRTITATKHTQNKGQDMTAKGPNLPEKVSIREQQGGREDLIDTPPWV